MKSYFERINDLENKPYVYDQQEIEDVLET